MFPRLLGVFLFSFAAVMPAQAPAQQYQQQWPGVARRAAPPLARPSAPAAIPHVAAPRFTAPPRISAPRPAAGSPYVTTSPRIAPYPRVSPRITAPYSAPRIARPRGPGTRQRVPEISARPRPQQQVTRFHRPQVRELRREDGRQVRKLQAEQRQHLRDVQVQRQHPERNTPHQLPTQEAQRPDDLRTPSRERRLGSQSPVVWPRPNGKARITPDSARQGRFSSRFMHQPHAGWRTERVAAHTAWGHRHRAAFVAWRGPVFWPFIYTDLFYYAFWPEAYDDAYWAYAYDDFLDSVYWAEGNPYGAYDYSGPTFQRVVARGRARTPRGGTPAVGQCESVDGITAWPFAQIERFLAPAEQQQTLLDELKAAAAQASSELGHSCPQMAPLTPTGRLQAMLDRLQATLGAVHAVHSPLIKFYDSLTDEQKARFNALGPNIGEKAQTSPADSQGITACAGQKSGLTELPIERIEDAVRPTDMQQAALDRLGKANEEAVAVLQDACPDSMPQTPVGRLDVIEKRLSAMIRAAKIIGPALQEFYGLLTDEQKSRFNTLGQQT